MADVFYRDESQELVHHPLDGWDYTGLLDMLKETTVLARYGIGRYRVMRLREGATPSADELLALRQAYIDCKEWKTLCQRVHEVGVTVVATQASVERSGLQKQCDLPYPPSPTRVTAIKAALDTIVSPMVY